MPKKTDPFAPHGYDILDSMIVKKESLLERKTVHNNPEQKVPGLTKNQSSGGAVLRNQLTRLKKSDSLFGL